jgi:type I restriction enzyme S subunit
MTLPHGWIEIQIGDMAQYLNGKAFKPSDWEEAGLPIVRIQNLNDVNAKYNFSSSVIDEKYKIESGDLLFAWSASLGAYIWHGKDAWLNQHIFKVIPYSGVNKTFLYYVLINTASLFYSKTHGSGMVHITKEPFESTKVSLPPLPEQQRIVAKIDSLFSELDNGVAFLKTIKAQLAIYRQAVLQWAFEGKLTTEWRKANDVENQEIVIKNIMIAREMEICKEKYKNIEPEFPLYDLPKEWKWVSIGFISKGVEYGTSAKSNKNGKVVVLRMGNIQNGTFVYDDLAYTSNKKEIEKYKLNEGDVLFNRTNSPELVGKTAIYTGSIPSIFAGYLIRLNQISYIDAKYLNYYLNSPHSKKCGNIAKTDGVNQSNINGTKLSTYPFPLCSKPEQLAIVSAIESRLSVCDKLEQTIDQTLALSASLRQSILKKAFEGRLVPQDPNDEPAEKLLERIKVEKAAVLTKQKQTRKRGRK